ncbi:MAG: Zn-ribbon containing protein [Nanoarchaeota archaeon]
MAHKCLRCGRIYINNREILTKGCICGSKLFVYIPDEKLSKDELEKIKETEEELKKIKEKVKLKNEKIENHKIEGYKIEKLNENSKKIINKIYNKNQKKEEENNNYEKLEKEIKELFNIKEEEILVLPLEAIQIIGEGKFLIDINKLFKEKVVVIKTKEGQYILQMY